MAKKVLIIDDSTANLTVISGVLSDLYKVYPIDSGATALRFFDKQRPDLILLDVEMPEMSGKELLGIIKADSRLSGIPVILLTGNTDDESEAEAFELGAADYIRKPVNNIILLARVKMHLELAEYRNSGAAR